MGSFSWVSKTGKRDNRLWLQAKAKLFEMGSFGNFLFLGVLTTDEHGYRKI